MGIFQLSWSVEKEKPPSPPACVLQLLPPAADRTPALPSIQAIARGCVWAAEAARQVSVAFLPQRPQIS